MTSSAASLIRDARVGAHLSQNDLARRAQVAQSVVSAYESGRREPSVPMLCKLVAATGNDLVLDVRPAVDARPGLPDTTLGRRLRRRRRAVLAVADRYGATNVRVFGSVARGEDGPDSDVDLLVDLTPGTGLLQLAALERELRQLLGVRVDVAPADSLKPRVRAAADRDAIPL
jgi:predicted nucleotidyltransferase/DNA-binding XRE family transcriptional regulator